MTKEKEQERKYYKLVFRRLPEKGYSESEFKINLANLCEQLGIPSNVVYFLHYIEGKNSRRRGPIGGAAYVTIGDENVVLKLLKYFQSPPCIPFIPSKPTSAVDLENPSPVAQLFYRQPDVSLALFPKAFKFKERPDKLNGLFEEDSEFKTFLELLDKPVDMLPSAESLLDQAVNKHVEDPKSTPMLVYLRKLGEKREAEKKALAAAKVKSRADAKGSKKGGPVGPVTIAVKGKTDLSKGGSLAASMQKQVVVGDKSLKKSRTKNKKTADQAILASSMGEIATGNLSSNAMGELPEGNLPKSGKVKEKPRNGGEPLDEKGNVPVPSKRGGKKRQEVKMGSTTAKEGDGGDKMPEADKGGVSVGGGGRIIEAGRRTSEGGRGPDAGRGADRGGASSNRSRNKGGRVADGGGGRGGRGNGRGGRDPHAGSTAADPDGLPSVNILRVLKRPDLDTSAK